MVSDEHDDNLITRHETQLDELNKDMWIVKNALGIKNLENGERDRQIQELKQRDKELGDKTEEEDKSISEKVTEILIKLEGKADKKELPSKFQINLNTFVMTMFILAILFESGRRILFGG